MILLLLLLINALNFEIIGLKLFKLGTIAHNFILYHYQEIRKECTITAAPGVRCAPSFYQFAFMLHRYFM